MTIGIVIPYYNTPKALEVLLQRIPDEYLEHTVVIDDGSDQPVSTTLCKVIRHPHNKGYGAAQKSGFQWLLSRGHDQILLVHGDDQYDFQSIFKAAQNAPHHLVLLGSRMLHPSHYNIPFWRRMGNHLLTNLANSLFDSNYTDLHTGARIYHREFLQTVHFAKFSDDFVFDHQMLAHCLAQKIPIYEFPIAANYEDGVSSISFRRSVRYGLGCVGTLWAAKRTVF